MNFSPEQQKAIDIRNTNVVVSASAGSGKTRVLVERLCQLVIRDHMSIDSILAMTFTNAAAAEMKARLRSRLLEEKQDAYISQQLALLETAHICTIDSFCLSVVQNYYYKIPISYTQANQLASEAQQKEAFDQGYQKALEITQPFHLLRYKSLCRISDDKFKSILQNCINLAWAKANPEQWFEDIKNENMSKDIDLWFYQFFLGHFKAIEELCESDTENHPFFIQKKESLVPCIKACVNQDYKTLYFEFKKHLTETGFYRFTKKNDEYSAYHSSIKAKINEHEKVMAESLFENSIFESDSLHMKQIRDEFCDLCLETKHQFSLFKNEMEVIDFGDMETMTLQLFQDPIVQREYQDQFETILIDEFQDTNDLQESIIQSIARKNNVFRVGDVKQSIYGFRQARPDIMRNHMNKKDKYNTTLVMDNNYRSNQSIVDFNNDFYQKIMNSPLLGSQFEDIDIAHTGLETQRNEPQYPIRFMYIDKNQWAKKHDKAPNPMEVLAQDILRQHKNGVPFKDICVLLRSRKPDTAYKEIFDAYEIPYVANVKTGFYTNKSVQIVVSTLKALMNPYDDIALTACLLSPLTSVTTEQLAQACLNKEKSIPLYHHLKDMDIMKDFHTLESYKYELPSILLQKLYAYRDFYYSSCTNQDRINLDFLLEKAYNQENTKQFIQQLKEDEKEDSISEKSVYKKEDNVVSIETMHGSKGLQYPIVYILYGATRDQDKTNLIQIDADLGISFKSITSDGTVKRTSKDEIALLTKRNYDLMKEEMRILYVATTRAQKELVFIDSIKDEDELRTPMDTHILLDSINYTNWIFHTYFNDPDSIVKFEQIRFINDRPLLKKPISKKMLTPLYHKETKVLETMTASATKIKKEWQPFEITNDAATKRGTLFHEAMATSYPYKEEELQKVAKRYNYKLTDTDLNQLLQVNDNALYKEWMSYEHQFECSYILEKDHKIIHGFMDLVIWEKDRVVIVDYKTDTVNNENELIQKYKSQLDTYQQAMEQIQDKPVSTYIYSFHLGAIIAIKA